MPLHVIEPLGDDPAPAAHGFRMPAEWEPHACTWMGWPHRPEYWLGPLEDTQKAYAQVANTIAKYEPVRMLTAPVAMESARGFLGDSVELVELEIDQAWLRDTGPNFLVNDKGELAGSTWQFNAWGNKYRRRANDALIGDAVLRIAGGHNFTSSIYAEGGGISVDGEGTVLTTEQSFLNSNRNPAFTKQEVEAELCRTLGARKVIWLVGDPDDDETDGHVDGLAAFVRPGLVLVERAPASDKHRRAVGDANVAALEGQTDAKGRPIELTFIEEAEYTEADGDVYCKSYVNSYMVNGAVIVPIYGIPNDDDAVRVYSELFPDRVIEQVPIHSIAIGGGGIHCITQQQPRG